MINSEILCSTGSERVIMGYPLSYWVDNYQMPLHLYYAPRIRENIITFKEVFEKYYPKGEVKYAIKAGAHHCILKIVKELGAGVDAASYNEVRCAIESGILPGNIDLNGNCKEDELIREAIRTGMLIVSDSFEEFDLIARFAAEMNIKPRVIQRISGYDLGEVTAASIFTAGVWTKFGAPLDEIPDFIRSLHRYPHIDFLGFHTHIGSQITDVEPYLAVLGKMIEMGHLLNETGRKCRVINLGGGFPVSYIDKESWEKNLIRISEGYEAAKRGDYARCFAWNGILGGFEKGEDGQIVPGQWSGEKYYSDYPGAKMLERILTSKVWVNRKEIPTIIALKELGEPTLQVEPGRSIIEDSGITLARVGLVRKIYGGNNLVVLEMGVVSHITPMFDPDMRKWEIATDFTRKDDEPFETFIGGNLCFSGDMLAKYKVSLQRKPERGDIMLIYDTGAYTSGYMPANANAFPRPARLLVDRDGEIKYIKKRDSYEEIFSIEGIGSVT